MHDRYRSRSRDGGYRRRSPRWHDDNRDGENYRSRKDSKSPPPPPDDSDMLRGRARHADDHSRSSSHHGRHLDRSRDGLDADADRDARRTGPLGPRPGDDGLWYDEAPREAGLSALDGAAEPHRHGDRAGPDGVPGASRPPRAAAPAPSGPGGRAGRSRSRDGRADSGAVRVGYSRDRSRDHARPARRRRATPTLILENLPGDITEKDILLGLDHVTGEPRLSIDQIRFVRIRSNKRGGRIAFVEFRHLYDASDFFDYFHPSFPLVLMHSRGVDSEPVTVGVDYSRPREDADRPEDGWECLECGAMNYPHRNACFKCKVERSDWRMGGYDDSGPASLILTGETDECPQQIPSQFIVVRDLEPSVTEEVLAKGVAKLFVDNDPAPVRDKPTANKLKSTAPTHSTAGLGAPSGSLRRVFLVRDRRSDESWRYGFAEFATVDDARAAVAKFNASPRFTIASKPVAVAFIHTGVFVPALEEASDFTFAPIYNPSLRVQYWDDRAYPSVFVVAGPIEEGAADKNAERNADKNADKNTGGKSGGTGGTGGAEGRRLKREKDMAAGKKALAMTPQMQMWAKKAAELHGDARLRDTPDDRETLPDAPPPPQAPPEKEPLPLVLDVSDSTDPVSPHWSDRYASYADWEQHECLVCERLFAQEWLAHHEVHAHRLYRDEALRARAAELLAARGKEPRTVVRRVPRRRCDPLPVYTSYADQESLVCHVCRRRLGSVKLLRRHERESELHRRNLARPGRVAEATARLAKAGRKPSQMLPLGYDGPIRSARLNSRGAYSQYRDRAQERRQVYNQPKRPAGPQGAPTEAKRSENATGETKMDEDPKRSKGAGLLAKMGWTAGAGLGAQGEGRTEALDTELYAPGVGLGAEGGRLGDATEEAARKTRNQFADFVEKTRDRARERFERLG